MAATVEIHRLTGAGPTSSRIDNNPGSVSRAGTKDEDTLNTDTSAPIKIPDAGADPKYSFWVSTCLKVTGGSWSTLDNIKWYTDGGSFGYAISGVVGYCSYADYQQATGTEADTGLEVSATHTALSGLNTNMFSYLTGGSELSGIDGYNLGVINSGLGTETSNIVVYQLAVYPEASAGATASPTITWQYDEI